MPYYVGGDYYGRGDYYRGDYYRGDPGLFSFIGKGLKKIAGVALSATPLGKIASTALSVIPTFGKRSSGLLAGPQGVPEPGLPGLVHRALPGGMSGYLRPRRMNPLNVKALRRATRRVDSFARVARRALRHTPYMLVSRGSRGKKKGAKR